MAIMCCIEVLSSNKEMSVEEFKAWVSNFDEDKDGRISRKELKEALHSLRSWWGWWKSVQAMKAADSDHTGLIDTAGEMDRLVLFAQQQLHMKIYDNDDSDY